MVYGLKKKIKIEITTVICVLRTVTGYTRNSIQQKLTKELGDHIFGTKAVHYFPITDAQVPIDDIRPFMFSTVIVFSDVRDRLLSEYDTYICYCLHVEFIR